MDEGRSAASPRAATTAASPISVYLDNNVWDFLFERGLDLAVELPRERFCLAITREAEFEIPAIPAHKADLKGFIADSIARCKVQTDCLFGFCNESLSSNAQRYGGFNIGRWASQEELAYLRQQRTPLRQKTRPTGLHPNEADRALAMRSFHSIVLTLDAEKGPINNAYQQGGEVVFLTDFDTSNLSLAQFILSRSARDAAAHPDFP